MTTLDNYRKLLNEELQSRGWTDEFRFRKQIVSEVMEHPHSILSPRMRQIKAIILGGTPPAPKKLMTLHEAQTYAKEKGFKLSKCMNKEYRVCPIDEGEDSAYYTSDMQDAIDTINNWR